MGPPGTGPRPSARRYCSLFDTEPAKGRVSLRPKYEYAVHDGRMNRERRERLIEAASARKSLWYDD